MLIVQVHFLKSRPEGDKSGVQLSLTPSPVPFSAGMIAYAATFEIPPGKLDHPVENGCCYEGFETLQAFSFRVHTHAMGR